MWITTGLTEDNVPDLTVKLDVICNIKAWQSS